jgi:hypothetical protein
MLVVIPAVGFGFLPACVPAAGTTKERAEVPNEAVEVTLDRHDNGHMTYRVVARAPSACYSAGRQQAVVDPDMPGLARIYLNLAYNGDMMCAQAITPVTFQGTLDGAFDVTDVVVVVRDTRSGSLTIRVVQP